MTHRLLALLLAIASCVASLQARTLTPDQIDTLHKARIVLTYLDTYSESATSPLLDAAAMIPSLQTLHDNWRNNGVINILLSRTAIRDMLDFYSEADNAPADDMMWLLLTKINYDSEVFDFEGADRAQDMLNRLIQDTPMSDIQREQWRLAALLETPLFERVYNIDEIINIIDKAKYTYTHQQFQNDELHLFILLILLNSSYPGMTAAEQTKLDNSIESVIKRITPDRDIQNGIRIIADSWRNCKLLESDPGNSFYTMKVRQMADNTALPFFARFNAASTLLNSLPLTPEDYPRAIQLWNQITELIDQNTKEIGGLYTQTGVEHLTTATQLVAIDDIRQHFDATAYEIFDRQLGQFDTSTLNGRRAAAFYTSVSALNSPMLLDSIVPIIDLQYSDVMLETSPRFQASLALNLSELLRGKGNYNSAYTLLDHIDFDLYDDCDRDIMRAKIETQKGQLQLDMAKPAEALPHFQAAAQAFEDAGEPGMAVLDVFRIAQTHYLAGDIDQLDDAIKRYNRVRPNYPLEQWQFSPDYAIAVYSAHSLPQKEKIKLLREQIRRAERNNMYLELAQAYELLAYELQNDPTKADETRQAYDSALLIYSNYPINPDILYFYRNMLTYVYSVGDFNAYNNIVHTLIDATAGTMMSFDPSFIDILADATNWATSSQDMQNSIFYLLTLLQQSQTALLMADNDPVGVAYVMVTAGPTLLNTLSSFRDMSTSSGMADTPFNAFITQADESIEYITDHLLTYLPNDRRTATYLYSAMSFLAGTDRARADNMLKLLTEHFPQYDTSEARLYFALTDNDLDTAAYIANERVSLIRTFYNNDNNLNISNIYSMLSPVYLTYNKQGRYDDIMDLARWRFDRSKKFVENNYASMTESQRAAMASNGALTPWDIHTTLPRANTPDNRRLAYDGALFFKNLLLQSASNFRNAIYASADTTAIARYEELLELDAEMKQLVSTTSSGAYIDDPDAQNQAAARMMELSQRHSTIEIDLLYQVPRARDISDRRKITWNDIRRRLTDNEAAIEFIITGNRFGALVLRHKGSNAPEYVPLISTANLNSLAARQDVGKLQNSVKRLYLQGPAVGRYAGAELFDSIWAPILPYLDGVDRIYYSPVGNLSVMALHALEDSDQRSMSDMYDMRLVSTTAAIPASRKKKPQSDITDVMMFGDVTYDADPNVPRRNWHRLEGSIVEVNTIDSILSGRIPTGIILGDQASEPAFRALRGHSPSCILMSTHGFFCPSDKIYSADYRNFLIAKGIISSDAETTFTDILPLKRAGLILADANPVWNNTDRRADDSDGILTAEEISLLDLSSTRLIVLSACETAKGEASLTEGVTGLQRALKLAGVESIVMTLWQVNDNTARLFMTEFFKHIADGKERHEAFNLARRAIRQLYPREPYHWAPFVMLD